MIFIPGNVPSSKNSKIVTDNGVFNSATVNRYLKSLGIQRFSSSKKTVKEYVSKQRPNIFREICEDYFKDIEYPCLIGIHFVRKTKRRCDFHNISQIILDLLVAHEFIEDDDMNHIFPTPLHVEGKLISYDKHNPGVYITIKKLKQK